MRSVLLASFASLAAVKSVSAHPSPHGSRGLNRRAVDLDAFRPKVTPIYKNATAVIGDPSIPRLSKRSGAEDVATELVKSKIPGSTFRLVGDSYVGKNGIGHFYFKQTANGVDIDTADFNVNVCCIVSSTLSMTNKGGEARQ